MDSPDVDSPDVDSPDVDSPDVDSPDVDSPDVDWLTRRAYASTLAISSRGIMMTKRILTAKCLSCKVKVWSLETP